MSIALMLQGLGLLPNVDTATDHNSTVPDRIAAGASVAAPLMSLAGPAIGGATAAATETMGGATIASLIGGGGAVGAGTALTAGGALLGAGATSYAAGTAIDKIGGRLMGGTQDVVGRGVGGAVEHRPDERRLSERMSDAMHTQTGDSLALRIAPYLPTWLGGG